MFSRNFLRCSSHVFKFSNKLNSTKNLRFGAIDQTLSIRYNSFEYSLPPLMVFDKSDDSSTPLFTSLKVELFFKTFIDKDSDRKSFLEGAEQVSRPLIHYYLTIDFVNDRRCH